MLVTMSGWRKTNAFPSIMTGPAASTIAAKAARRNGVSVAATSTNKIAASANPVVTAASAACIAAAANGAPVAERIVRPKPESTG